MSDDSLDLALYGAFDGTNAPRLAKVTGLPDRVVLRKLQMLQAEHEALREILRSGGGLTTEQRDRFVSLEHAFACAPAIAKLAVHVRQIAESSSSSSVPSSEMPAMKPVPDCPDMREFVLQEAVRAAACALREMETDAVTAATKIVEAYRAAEKSFDAERLGGIVVSLRVGDPAESPPADGAQE